MKLRRTKDGANFIVDGANFIVPIFWGHPVHHWYKFGENPTNTFQDVLTSAESVVSSILYSIVTLTVDLLTPNCKTFISVPCRIFGVSLVKLCQIRLQDVALTMFRDAHTDAPTNRTKSKNSMSPATLRLAEA